MTNASDPVESGPRRLELVDDDPTAEENVDGRTLRRQRNRAAVIDALISLIRDGDLEPTVAKIADRAEVSHRSVFRYFDDLDDLGRTAIETEFRNAFPMSVVPDVGEGTLEHRVYQIVKRYLDVLERTHSLGRVARTRTVSIPEIDRGLHMINQFRTDQIARQFEPELEQLEEPKRTAILTACVAAVGFENYDTLARMQGLERSEIAELWTIALMALLA